MGARGWPPGAMPPRSALKEMLLAGGWACPGRPKPRSSNRSVLKTCVLPCHHHLFQINLHNQIISNNINKPPPANPRALSSKRFFLETHHLDAPCYLEVTPALKNWGLLMHELSGQEASS